MEISTTPTYKETGLWKLTPVSVNEKEGKAAQGCILNDYNILQKQ
jgi:hypothetical protein